MKKLFIFLSIIFLSVAPVARAASVTTTGFISDEVWYSKNTIKEGDTVNIYTALWNNSGYTLNTKIEFYDQNVVLGNRDIIIPNLQLKQVSVSWKVISGDHSIFAKIISPNISVGMEKKNITIDSLSTNPDKIFIPANVNINNVNGQPTIPSSDIIKNQISKATSSIDKIIPESISTPVSTNASVLDNFRLEAYKDALQTKNETQNKIDVLNKSDTTGKVAGTKVSAPPSKGIENATDKPIAYLKLFFFSVLAFIFGSRIAFYSLIVIVVFFILRYIYRKIRY